MQKISFDWREEVVMHDTPQTDLSSMLEADNLKTEKVEFLLHNEGVGFAARGNVHAIVSQMKQGKTYGALSMAAAAIGGAFGSVEAETPMRVLVFDTEQDEADVKARKNAVVTAAGGGRAMLRYVSARRAIAEANPWDAQSLQEWRALMLELCIVEFSPQLVVLDGLRDLCQDINDTKEAARVMSFVERLAAEYRCAIYCVLHLNKDEKNARGHIGTELQNKCADFFTTKKIVGEGGVTHIVVTMSAEKSRHNAAPAWVIKASEDDWGFSYETDTDMLLAGDYSEFSPKRGRPTKASKDEYLEQLSKYMDDLEEYTPEQMRGIARKVLAEQGKKTDAQHVRNYIRSAVTSGAIAEDEGGNYTYESDL